MKSKQMGFEELEVEDISRPQMVLNQRNKYGNYIVLMSNSDGTPKFLLGPHWYIFVLSFLVCCFLLAIMLYNLQTSLANVWFYLLLLVSFLFAFTYLKIGLSNPGFAQPIFNPSPEQRQNPRFCETCQTIRNLRVYHCYDCDICIQNYDHHCPWIGKCVGKNNLNLFYVFLIVTFGTLIICLIAAIGSTPSRNGGIQV